MFYLIAIIFASISSCDLNVESTEDSNVKTDNISIWISQIENDSIEESQRKKLLRTVYTQILKDKPNTTNNKNLSKIAYQSLKFKDTVLFKKINRKALELAMKMKDSFAIGDIHWNYASYYNKKEVYDSAYFHFNKAYRYFENTKNQNLAAKMLYGMAFIKGRFKDYTESEILNIRAIKKYKILNDKVSLYNAYNHLATLQKELNEFDKALLYHNKALRYLNKIKNTGTKKEGSLNNIGIVYHKKGDYAKAIEYFEKGLNSNVKNNNLKLYAKLIDNRAYSKLHNKDTVNLKKDFYQSLRIRDSIKNVAGVVINKLHLSEFYKTINDSLNAFKYAKEANALAKKIKNNRDYLSSLKLLSEVDVKRAKKYLSTYIKFNDSLLNVEHKIKNKFARIAYETDEYIEKNKRLSEQKIWGLVIGLIIIFSLLTLFFIKTQKSKDEKYMLERMQQKSNEQIYILTLKQQSKLEEGKRKERKRISEELHDDVLGRLFGTRIGLGFLDIEGNKDTLSQYQSFIEELQSVEKIIREVSHKLNNNFNESEINFITLLDKFLENKCKIGKFTYQLNNNEGVIWESINEIIKINLYRIVQESIQNVIKYSKAKKVILDFSIKDNNLIVYIKDDGAGFDTKKTRKGIGIKNMKSRVDKLHGIFQITSKKDNGTMIHFIIPIKE